MNGSLPRPPSFLRRHMAANVVEDDVLVGLACDESLWVRREAANNPATPQWIIDLLVRAGADSSLRGTGSPDLTMPVSELRRLVECGPWAQQLVAEHPSATSEILHALVKHPSARVRAAVAAHPAAAPSTLAMLCADADEAIRTVAAAHPERPEAEYRLLCAAGGLEPELGNQEGAGAFDTAEIQRLAELGPWGRFLAGRMPACPAWLLAEVSNDADWKVRSAVLENPNSPDEMMLRIAAVDEAADGIALRALSDREATAAALLGLAGHAQAEVRLAVGRHPNLDAELVAVLAVDRTAEVRTHAAAHPLMDPGWLELLVRAGSSPDLTRLAPTDAEVSAEELANLSQRGYWARQLAVRHPATPPDVLARLLCDEDPKLREWAGAHPKAPADVIAEIRRAGGAHDYQGLAEADPDLTPEALRDVAALGHWGRWLVSWHPNAPADMKRPGVHESAEPLG